MDFATGVITALTQQDREAERTATMETPAPGGGGGAPTNATYVVLSLNATLTDERVLTGTANQVIVTDNGAGSTVVLSLPQSIATTSSPSFTYLTLATGFTVTNFGNGAVLYTSGAGIVNGNGNGLFFSTGLGLVVNLASGSTVDLLVRTSSMPEALFVDASANAIGINQGTIDPSAILDITSTTKGLLPPRMTTVQRDAIGSPAAGLVLYDVTTGLLNYRNASAWVTLSTPTVTGSGAATRVAYWSSASALTSDADFTFDGSQVALAVQGVTGGILVGGDVQWYRSAANVWLTPDAVTIGGDTNISNGILIVTGLGNRRIPFFSASVDGLFVSSANLEFDTLTMTISVSNATTTPQLIIANSSTGDAAQRYALSTTISYAVGIDNSVAGDPLVWSTAASATAVLGTGDLMRLTSAGLLSVGNQTVPLGLLHLSSNASATLAYVDNYSGSAANTPGLVFRRARGTLASPLVSVSGDRLGTFTAQGMDADGGTFRDAAAFDFYVDGTPGASDMPGRIEFRTTPDGSATLATRLTITNDGRIFGGALHNNAGAVTGATNQYLASGTYTPTLTNTTNIAASTAYQCQWMRVGNVVTVSGKVDIDPTAAGSAVMGVSLPIASNLGAQEDLGGVGFTPAVASVGFAILGDLTNDRATFQYIVTDTANRSFYFTFTYEVI